MTKLAPLSVALGETHLILTLSCGMIGYGAAVSQGPLEERPRFDSMSIENQWLCFGEAVSSCQHWTGHTALLRAESGLSPGVSQGRDPGMEPLLIYWGCAHNHGSCRLNGEFWVRISFL
ncbi:hypothetical protein BKA56DRAFT_309593 [Ilyonectria sp. MPI-CAGE-AT-0026]|nr:hypothetical protein BKA56DRAFT_309593 [Ilyonectria sp. MPI-CAGE-AT-0026]